MNPSFNGKRPGWCAACALALGFAFGPAQASDIGPGAHIWKNTDGVWCWNRAFVAAPPPSNCSDPDLVAQSVAPAAAIVAAPAAPAQPESVAPIAAPSPVQAQYVAPAAAPVATARARRMDRH